MMCNIDIGNAFDTFAMNGSSIYAALPLDDGFLHVSRPLGANMIASPPLVGALAMLPDGSIFYSMSLTCVDILAGSVLIVNTSIYVTLGNRAPVFDMPFTLPIRLNVRENVAIGTALLQLIAVDPDPSDLLVFTVVSQTPLGRTWCSVDRSSGLVTTATDINYRQVMQISIVVKVTDSGGLYSDLTVVFSVLDVNDNDPVFTGVTGGSQGLSGVMAGSPLLVRRDEATNHALISLTASDADSDGGGGGNVTYGLVAGNERVFFEIDPVTG